MSDVTRLIAALTESNSCLAEAALVLEKHGEALASDLLKQVAQNAELIREIGL